MEHQLALFDLPAVQYSCRVYLDELRRYCVTAGAQDAESGRWLTVDYLGLTMGEAIDVVEATMSGALPLV